jgi:putative drug exporter of the RND superfamily
VLSLLIALTLLPAILAILGSRINLWTVVPARFTTGRIWRAVARRVMDMPWIVIGLVALVVAVLALPASHLRVGIPGPEILPPSVDSRAGNNLLNAKLGIANGAPVLVAIRRDPHTPASSFRSAALAVLDRICVSNEVAGVAGVPVPSSPSQVRTCESALLALENASPAENARARLLAQRHSLGLISVFLRTNPSSAAAEQYVTRLRQAGNVRGYTILIGGQTAGQMDFDNYLYSRFPLVILFVILTIYVVLFVAFRSLLLPLKAVLMNLLSVLAAYGATVFAFQDAHLSGLLGFTPVGNIDSIVPVFLFCVLFGVSTDYEVFLLTRVQEEFLAGASNEESVATGIAATGRIITSAAAVMVVIFGAFAFARLVVIQEVGLGLAVAVFVDATLIRALLVPATMRVLGRWNWWLPAALIPRRRSRPSEPSPEGVVG